MERIDLFTTSREPLGRSIERGEPIEPGTMVLVVAVFTIRSDHRLLVTLRSPGKNAYPNTWENTGGAVQAGETTLDAAKRELFEETGIHAEKEDFVFLGTVLETSAFVDLYLNRYNIEVEDVVFQEGETVAARLVTPEEFEQLIEQNKVCTPVAVRWYQYKDKILAAMDEFAAQTSQEES